MAFPDTPLSANVEIYYSAGWHAIPSSKVRVSHGMTVTRGIQDESSRVDNSSFEFTINNLNGDYSPRNPRSPLFGLIGRNTPLRFALNGFDVTADSFNRYVTSGWGVSEYNGETWTFSGGGGAVAATDTSVGSAGAVMSVPAGPASRRCHLAGVPLADVAVSVRTRWLDTAGGFDVLGGAAEGGLMLRVQSTSTYYHPRLEYNADQTLTASLHAIGGTGSIGTVTVPAITYTGQWLRLKAQCLGSTIRMKVWEDGTAEPAGWTLSVTDVQITAAGGIGVRSGVAAANTNTGRLFYYTDFTTDHTFRAAGEVVAWPQKWTVGGKDVWVPMQVAGIRRRLGITTTGQAVSRSALRRMVQSPAATYRPYTYYPMEEKQAAASLVDAVGTGTPMLVSGATNAPAGPNFGSSSLFVGSDGLPALDHRTLTWTFPVTGGSDTEWTLQYVGSAEGSLEPASRLFLTSGMQIIHSVGNGYNMVTWYNNDATVTYDQFMEINTSRSNWFDGLPHTLQLSAKQVGGNISWTMMLDGTIVAAARTFAGTLSRPAQGQLISTNDGTKATFGHYGVWAGVSGGTLPSYVSAMNGWAGDTAAGRITRLCAEEGVTLSLMGARGTVNTVADGSELVGVQRVAAFNDLTQDAADADRGLLYEPRGFLGLAYRTGRSLYNQAPTVALTYNASGHVAWPLDPIDDDSAIENDVTVSRYQGGSARVEQLTGPLNVREPSADPNGAGRYAREHQLVLYADTQCLNTAAWLRHLGTWDEARYPNVNINVAHLAAKTGSTLPGQALSLGIGHRFTIDSLPNWLPPDRLEQHALGFVETFNGLQLDIRVNAVPALPYEIYTIQTGTGNRSRIPTGGSSFTADATNVATIFYIFSPGVVWIDSVSYAAQFPFDVMSVGERMTVTAIRNYLNANPYFETPLNASSWTAQNGATIAANGAQFHQGAQSLLITPDGVSFAPQALSEEMPATALRSYILSGWLRSASSGTRKLGLFWYDSTHTFISANELSQVLAPGVWTQYGPTPYTAPASTAYMRIASNDPGAPLSSNSWRLDEITVTQANTQVFIVTRSVNGIVKAHFAGEAVQLFNPPVIAL